MNRGFFIKRQHICFDMDTNCEKSCLIFVTESDVNMNIEWSYTKFKYRKNMSFVENLSMESRDDNIAIVKIIFSYKLSYNGHTK